MNRNKKGCNCRLLKKKSIFLIINSAWEKCSSFTPDYKDQARNSCQGLKFIKICNAIGY